MNEMNFQQNEDEQIDKECDNPSVGWCQANILWNRKKVG